MRIIFFILTLISTTLFASEIEDLKQKAINGDANSQFFLGLDYAIGSNVNKDLVESKKWIKLAAQNGNLVAQLNYGQDLTDYVEGLKWIKKSSESGYIQAQIYLGELYRTPENPYVEVDIKKSLKFLEKAAYSNDFGSLDASFRLFLMFEEGDGVEKNPELASKWLNLSVRNNFSDSKSLYENGIKRRTYNNGFKYIRLAAEMGNPKAQNELGIIYTSDYKGFNSPEIGRIVVNRNGKKALKWLKEAAKNGVNDAYYRLGVIYDYGMFKKDAKEGDWYEINPDKYEAVKYYEWAKSAGHSKATKRLDIRDTFDSKPWSKYDSAKTNYVDNYLQYTWFESLIAFSKGGNKRLYFSIKEDKNLCDPYDYKDGSTTTWEVNQQAISMITFCDKSHKDFYFISATPKSDRGLSFIVDTLSRSNSDVIIKGSGYSFPISSSGFTQSWNRKSNTAL